jgi:hypothetical protein
VLSLFRSDVSVLERLSLWQGEEVVMLWWGTIGMCIGLGRANLTVLTPPDKVGLASASTLFILLETADGYPVRVDFAARCTLHFERIIERCVLRVCRPEICYAVAFVTLQFHRG